MKKKVLFVLAIILVAVLCASYQKLYWLLKPLLVSSERSMFMKKEDWEKRLKRFEEIQS